MPNLLDLPPEVIVLILCYLDLPDFVSAIRTNHTLYNTRTVHVLRYRFALQAAAVEDNPDSSVLIAQRLALLKDREEGWGGFNFDFRRKIPVRHTPSGIYDMTGGIYLLGDENRRALHYCKLPSKPSDPATWSQIRIDRELIDMGLAIYEHDLIAVVTTTQHPTHVGMHVIELLLLEFSSGKHHPLARSPVLFVAETRWPRPSIGIEIVGDNLALITNHFLGHQRPRDTFYVFDWKTGALKMKISAPHDTYSGLVFLSPTLVLLPNTQKHCFDIWSIPASPPPNDPSSDPSSKPRPLLSLELPTLNLGQFMLTVNCRSEPGPTLNGTPHSNQPFHAAPEDAIVIFNLRLGHAGIAFSLFVHRSALLSLAREAQALETYARYWGDISVGAVMNDGKMELMEHRMPETIVEIEPQPDQAGAPVVYMHWQDWGPPVTRWFDADDMPTRWITTSAGQRCVMSIEDVEAMDEDELWAEELRPELGHHWYVNGTGSSWDQRGGPPLTVLDFNPVAIQRMLAERGAEQWIEHQKEGRRTLMKVVTTPSKLKADAFKDPVESALPYVSLACWPPRGQRFEFAGVLMDEERLLGIRVDPVTDHIVQIEVMHMGIGKDMTMDSDSLGSRSAHVHSDEVD
ncbi:hypothetical protein FPV67DRAFT_1782712 [Lyophyllum atratum]|nr:hypothetical protein FPV67DRAFT_1782712 [Lyophyllum atratum]